MCQAAQTIARQLDQNSNDYHRILVWSDTFLSDVVQFWTYPGLADPYQGSINSRHHFAAYSRKPGSFRGLFSGTSILMKGSEMRRLLVVNNLERQD